MSPHRRSSSLGSLRADRLSRSIVQSQLLTSLAVLLLTWIVILVKPVSLAEPLLYSGIAAVFVITGVTLLVPWTFDNRPWAMLLPVLDIVAIVVIRAGEPTLAGGLLLVLPVLWLSRNYRVEGTVIGVVLSTVLLWASRLATGQPLDITDFPSLGLLPLTLAIIAVSTYIGSRRNAGQRTLLRRQAHIIERAFERARQQERLLDEIINAVSFGVIAFDRNGEVTLMNDAQRRSLSEFGAPRTAVVHPVVYQADRETPYPQNSRPFARAVRGQSFENITIWAGEPGSRQAAYAVTSRHLTDADGNPDGGVIVQRDVTAELEAIRARDSLIGSVSTSCARRSRRSSATSSSPSTPTTSATRRAA